MKYRIEETITGYFYPQRKYSWWPFWFYFEKDENCREFFFYKFQAETFIDNYIKDQSDLTKHSIYHDYPEQ